jgi:hypothetical protein
MARRILSLATIDPGDYRAGLITPTDGLAGTEEAAIRRIGTDFEVAYRGPTRWGDKNSVIRDSDGTYYLANLTD